MGLALSGAAHLALLALVLWIQARNVVLEPAWNAAPVHLVHPIVDPVFPPSIPPSSADAATDTPIDTKGPVVPVDKPTLPDIRATGPISRPSGDPGPGPSARQSPETGVRAAEPLDDPPESAVVAFEVAPVPTFRPEPLYPEWCREQRIEGRVVLHALVGRDGRVKRVSVARGVKGLSEPAMAAIGRWLFKPATFGGKPVAVWVEIPVEFKL